MSATREVDELRAELARANALLRDSHERISEVAARPSRPPARKAQHARRVRVPVAVEAEPVICTHGGCPRAER